MVAVAYVCSALFLIFHDFFLKMHGRPRTNYSHFQRAFVGTVEWFVGKNIFTPYPIDEGLGTP